MFCQGRPAQFCKQLHVCPLELVVGCSRKHAKRIATHVTNSTPKHHLKFHGAGTMGPQMLPGAKASPSGLWETCGPVPKSGSADLGFPCKERAMTPGLGPSRSAPGKLRFDAERLPELVREEPPVLPGFCWRVLRCLHFSEAKGTLCNRLVSVQ